MSSVANISVHATQKCSQKVPHAKAACFGFLGSMPMIHTPFNTSCWNQTTTCHFLHEVLVSSMHRNGHCRAHECLPIIGLERAESRRVVLSSGLRLES